MAAPDWKVLLIGGGVGTGKSTLALQLSRLLEVAALDGDDLRWAVESAVPPGADPSLDILRAPELQARPIETNVDRALAWSRRLCEISEPLVARRHFARQPVIIEAVWLLPEFACRSTFDAVPMEEEVRSLFLFEPDRETLRERLLGRDGALQSPADLQSRIEVIVEYGTLIAAQARRNGLPVLNSRPPETLVRRALDALGAQ